ncbi:MAG: YdcF family protein [Flavobacteriales bacterium]|nr:YdcF family protein [Flavobacteriales bacterium]
MKKHLKWIVAAAILITIFIVYSDFQVKALAKNRIFDEVEQLPESKSALVLGTSPTLKSGKPNWYFTYRINATVKLYKSGKVKYIVVSGDNSRKDYDESTAMKDSLISRGIPAEVIFIDYAGFRTLDSVVRMKEIFGQDGFIIVSQKFHNQRAVYLARKKGIDAYGLNAKDITSVYGLRVHAREKLARVKAVLDIVFNKKPHFLGDKIELK